MSHIYVNVFQRVNALTSVHVAVQYCNGDYAHGNNLLTFYIPPHYFEEVEICKSGKQKVHETQRALFPWLNHQYKSFFFSYFEVLCKIYIKIISETAFHYIYST